MKTMFLSSHQTHCQSTRGKSHSLSFELVPHQDAQERKREEEAMPSLYEETYYEGKGTRAEDLSVRHWCACVRQIVPSYR